MKKLLKITDSDLGLEAIEVAEYKKREASRAIIFNPEGKIALLHVGRDHYHKLPGGGIDEGETWQQGVVREALEEVGANVTLRGIELGAIVEHRQKHQLHQVSYCCIADLSGELQEMQREEDEIKAQQLPLWVTLDEAIELVEADDPDDYQGKFITVRDLTFLKAAKEAIN